MKIRVLETSLYVDNLDESEKFYRDLLGCKTLLADDRMRALNIGDTNVLLLFKRGGTTDGEEVPGGFIPPHDATGQIHLCFAIEKEDLENFQRVLDANNVEVISTVFPPRGGTSLYFRDLDGHLIELATPGIWEIY
jgi:catechol 2,3-dioxygenase-like lactoylglutathione lyase family enzyme